MQLAAPQKPSFHLLTSFLSEVQVNAIYPVIKTQFLLKRGVWKCVISAWLPWSFLQVNIRDISKNPGPCRNHTFPNLVHHQNLESTRPCASQTLMMHLIGKCAICACSCGRCHILPHILLRKSKRGVVLWLDYSTSMTQCEVIIF